MVIRHPKDTSRNNRGYKEMQKYQISHKKTATKVNQAKRDQDHKKALDIYEERQHKADEDFLL